MVRCSFLKERNGGREGMKQFWKRTGGWAAMCVLTLLISLAMQVLAGMVISVVYSMIAGFQAGLMGITDMAQLQEFIMNKTMSAIPVAVFIYQIAALPIFGVWLYFQTGRQKPLRITKVFRLKTVAVVVLSGLAWCVASNTFVLLAQYIAPDITAQYLEMMEMAGFGSSILVVITSVLIAPVGEELLCRGLIFYYAKRSVAHMENRTGAFWIANSIQALMFAVMHGNLIQGLYAFFIGLALGWMTERYHSLYPAMLAHLVINLFSTFGAGYVLVLLPDNAVSYGLATLLSLAVAVGVMLLDRKKA